MARTPVLSVQNLSKTFAGRTVLRSATLDVSEGEIHALVGQNGSGKSTLIKILSGYQSPDPGGIVTVCGDQISLPLSPTDPYSMGMSFVHQDLGLAESLSVVDNLRVGHYERRFGWRISWRRERALVRKALKDFDLAIDPDAPVGSLREVERAMVAIIRALERLRRAREGDEQYGGLLVLDEPTAYLPRDGVDRLFAAMRDVTTSSDRAAGVLFVTHRLDEVRAITDRVTILRDGAVVASSPTSSLTERDLIFHILGRSLEDLYPSVEDSSYGDMSLTLRNISGHGVRDFSLDVRRGEIVGLTGLLGMGHDRVLYLLFGAETPSEGSLVVEGRTYDLRSFTPRAAMAAGISFLPANRLKYGCVGSATVSENVTLPTLQTYFGSGVLHHRREAKRVSDLLTTFEVHPSEPGRTFSTLSGGNQQKALLGKWFETKGQILLLHEPTQGVDVGARHQIFVQLRAAAAAGVTILVASTEYEDLAHLCDRVIVFRDGVATARLEGSALTHERIVEQCFVSVLHSSSI